MEYKEFINFIEEGRLVYRGRAMAFYEDGRDYGVVTVMSAKSSHHLVSSHTCFIYSEASHELIGISNIGGHVGKNLFEAKTASCGRKYVLTFNTNEGEKIFVGNFF